MTTYFEMVSAVKRFMREEKIDAWDLHRIVRDLCCCKMCKYYTQHYDSKGNELDFGHCVKCNIPKSVKPSTNRCGSWVADDADYEVQE